MDAETTTSSKPKLVEVMADRLRERIFAQEPGEPLGSLNDLAREMGVGIVTVQQVARVLEHEGLLDVRRGPGGGYFGRRPDITSLERSFGAYLRSVPSSWEEALDITSLLFNELCAAAARCRDEAQFPVLEAIGKEIAASEDKGEIGPLESRLQEHLFRMVRRPLFEMLTRVAIGVSVTRQADTSFRWGFGLEHWRASRTAIIRAILARDPDLAHFEANRTNRREVLRILAETGAD